MTTPAETAPHPGGGDDVLERLHAIDEDVMYLAPASVHRAVADAITEIERLRAQVATARREAIKEALKGFEEIHNSLLRNGPKQASGELTAYWLDRFRALKENDR